MTTNMAERSRTAETGQCQPQSPGRGERGRAPLLQGLLAVAGARLASECRGRSPSLRGKGGKRLLAEGSEVEKGPGAEAPAQGAVEEGEASSLGG